MDTLENTRHTLLLFSWSTLGGSNTTECTNKWRRLQPSKRRRFIKYFFKNCLYILWGKYIQHVCYGPLTHTDWNAERALVYYYCEQDSLLQPSWATGFKRKKVETLCKCPLTQYEGQPGESQSHSFCFPQKRKLRNAEQSYTFFKLFHYKKLFQQRVKKGKIRAKTELFCTQVNKLCSRKLTTSSRVVRRRRQKTTVQSEQSM